MGHLNGETRDPLMKLIPIGRRQLRRHFGQYRASSYCRQTDSIDTNNNSARPFLSVDNGERHAVPTKTVQRGHICQKAQELCESRDGRPGLPSLISLRFLWT